MSKQRAEIEGRLNLDSTRWERGLQKSKQSISKFVSSGIAQMSALAGIAGFGGLIRSAINLGSKISDLAVQLRIGTTEFQVLRAEAREAGIASDVLERALRNIQLRTQGAIDGNKAYAEALQRLGLYTEEFINLSTDKKMEAIAIAQIQATDSAQAYRDVATILGERAGPQLQEVLQKLANKGFADLEKSARQSGEIMDKDTIQKMDEAADTIERFRDKLTVITATVITKLVPGLKILGEYLGFVGDSIGTLLLMLNSFRVTLFNTIKDVISPAITSLKGLGKGFVAVAKAIKGDFAGSKAAIVDMVAAQMDALKNLKDIPSEISSNFSEMKTDMLRDAKSLGDDLGKRSKEIRKNWAEMWNDFSKNDSPEKGGLGPSSKPGETGGTGGTNPEVKSKMQIFKLQQRIKEMEDQAIRERALGDQNAATAMENRLKTAKRIVELMSKGFSREEAGKIAFSEFQKGVSDSAGVQPGILSQGNRGIENNQFLSNLEGSMFSGSRRSSRPMVSGAPLRGNMQQNEKGNDENFLKQIYETLRKLDKALN